MSFDDHFGIKDDQKQQEIAKEGHKNDKESYFDQEYFGSIEDMIKTHTTSQSKKYESKTDMPSVDSHTSKSEKKGRPDLNFIDKQYFDSTDTAETDLAGNSSFRSANISGRSMGSKDYKEKINMNKRWIDDSAPKDSSKFNEKMSAKEFAEQFRQKEKLNPHLTPMPKNYVDSHGFRIPNERKFLFEYMTKDEVVSLLLKCILANKEDVIALNKPYGLPTHDGPGHRFNIVDLLPDVASRLKLKEDLQIVHRLDKETTGLMLIAKNKPMAHTLKEAFNKSWIQKTYLCVTTKIPQPSEGLIDIPLKNVEIGKEGIYKTMLRPKYNENHSQFSDIMNHYGSSGSSRALTYYTVLQSSKCAALVQCHSLTGIKHQIRVHFSMALNTPILGDHKYSHSTRLAPQRLPISALKHLNIRQSKARYLSLHLHAQRLVLEPDMDPFLLKLAKENLKDFSPPPKNTPRLNFFAPLPNFFMDNLRRLDLMKAQKALKLIRSHVI